MAKDSLTASKVADLEAARVAEQERRMGGRISEELTPERIAEHRKRLGSDFSKVTTLRNINVHGDITWDNIIRFSDNIGDINPLYFDPEYAKKTGYGALVAHPCFVMSITPGVTIQGLPGIHIVVSGFEYEFVAPILVGDEISHQMIFADLEEKRSGSLDGDLMLIEHYDTTFRNQFGQVVVKEDGHAIRFGRKKVSAGLAKNQAVSAENMPAQWTEEQVRAFEDAQIAEEIRGSNPRYWEDVSEGQDLPEFIRGPVSITDLTAQLGAFTVWKSGPALIRDLRKHGGYSYFHPESHAYEHLELIHISDVMAHGYGFPHPYDSGHVRSTLIATTLMHWAGDHGWLKKFFAEARQFLYASDVVRIHSKIVRKYQADDGEFCVDIETKMINNRDALIMPSRSTMALPSKKANTRPVAARIAARQDAVARSKS